MNVQKDIIINSADWKSYYYLVICMVKQREADQTFLSDYALRKKDIDENKCYIIKNRFYASNFQGQLSKSVFSQRKKLKLTQDKLSKISGVDRSMISKIEKVKQPTTLETAIKLLSALNMDIAICPLGGSGER